MTKLFLQTIGWLLAHTPEPLLRASSRLAGAAVFLLMRRRRRLFFSNLGHAFPDRPRTWHAHIARESSCRVIETLLLSLASPYIPDSRLRTMTSMSPEAVRFFAEHHSKPRAWIIATVHMAYWESLTALSLCMDVPLPELGVVFRPLDNASADAWIKATRERHGMRLLSRKDGLAEAFRMLRRQSVVGLLFDQNAGLSGALTLLFGRVCSTSELAGMLVERSHARLTTLYPRRLDFWRVRFEADEIACDGTTQGATIALNRWLETKLAGDDNLCASWLWSHDRWRHQDMPSRRLRLESKKNILDADLAARGAATLPRRTRLWVRLPNWLGDVVMALPLLRALRASRPDAEITLIGKGAFRPLVEGWGVSDNYEPLPKQGFGYFRHFWKLRTRHPDAYLLFTHSARGDLEARLTGCLQRFGLVKQGRRRPLLSHRYRVPADFDERAHHQLELWENYLRHFGLNAPANRTPLSAPVAGGPGAPIGFIAGSENNPEKRWPVSHWRTLLAQLLEEQPGRDILLFGTANDRPITSAVAQGFGPRVHDLAGRTDLPAYIEKLRSCRLLVTNDTGGMHLANSLGVPLIALFGPTNPIRTGPVFSAPFEILQPDGCPASGGMELALLTPETVIARVRQTLATPPASATV